MARTKKEIELIGGPLDGQKMVFEIDEKSAYVAVDCKYTPESPMTTEIYIRDGERWVHKPRVA